MIDNQKIKDIFGTIKGIIFDLDGTITDTESIFRDNWVQLAKDYGLEPNPEFPIAICGSSKEDAKQAIKKYYPSVDPVRFRDECMDRVSNIMDHYIPLKPGAKEFIKYMYKQNIPLTIASSNNDTQIKKNLKKVDLLKYFYQITSGEEITWGKPSPDIFLRAVDKLKLNPQDCLVFEDASNGVNGAHTAGCKVIMIPDLKWPDKELASKCDYVCKSFNEILDALNN